MDPSPDLVDPSPGLVGPSPDYVGPSPGRFGPSLDQFGPSLDYVGPSRAAACEGRIPTARIHLGPRHSAGGSSPYLLPTTTTRPTATSYGSDQLDIGQFEQIRIEGFVIISI